MTDMHQPHLFEPPPKTQLTLADRFLVPPFSVLDARQGYWRERKQAWAALGIRGELGRGENLGGQSEAQLRQVQEGSAYPRGAGAKEEAAYLDSGAGRGDRLLSNATPRNGYGGDYNTSNGENAWGGAGTSIFDPVLCELAYRWFCPEGGQVLDPFAGGSVRGIVAAHLGRRYYGCDLRPEQVESNRQQAAAIGAHYTWPHVPEWEVADSAQLLQLLPEGWADYVFSCPPYYNLEQYSDDPADLSNAGTYADFLHVYTGIIGGAVRALKPDRFACFVVGDIRDKRSSAYLGFVADTVRAFEAAGAAYYNEGILVTAVGSLPIRTSSLFGPGRKLGKTHQNILVFVKGDWRKAAAACPELSEVAIEYGGAALPILEEEE